MNEFCVHERHGGICEKTGTYCNLGACPYEDLQKFENLVTRCVWELPQKERELERLNQEISERRQQLGRISHTARSLSHQLTDMSCKVMELSAAIARAQEQE